MPEQFLGKLKDKIQPQWKACFLWALIVGAVAHFYKLANWLPNWDSLVFRYDAQDMLKLGRWFLSVAAAPSSFYDLPWLAGLMAILFYALGAVCICQMFGVQKKVTAALIGAAVVSFPNVTSVLMYNYVADAYALAFLLSCLSAQLMICKKGKVILPAILLALSVGIYQAYLTMTVMLVLCHLILRVARQKGKLKDLLLDAVRFLITGALGMGLYYGVLTALLQLTGTALLDYQGLNGANSLENLDLWGSLYTVKESFFGFFFDFSQGIHLFHLLNGVIFAGLLAFYLEDILRNKGGWLRFGLLCLLAIALPVGASLLSFINSGVDYHNLMKKGFFVFYLLFILQYENTTYRKAHAGPVKSWAILAVAVALVFNQTVIANVSYHKLNMAYEKSYGVLIRIADRMEQTPGAEGCDRILVLGALEGSEAYSAMLPPDMTGTTDGWILRADDEVVGQSVLCSALNDYCGKNYTIVSGEEKTALLDRIDAEKMGIWPEKDSILIEDNVIIIRLGNEVQ